MKLDRKSKRVRGTVFVVAHLAVLAMIFGCVLLPIRELFADRDAHIGEQDLQLARLEGIASQQASVRALARQIDVEAQKGEFLVGSSDGLISADLQTRLKFFAEAAGAHVRSAQNLPVKTVGQVKYSGSRVEIYGNIQALRKAIHGIEGARPYLFITSANMKLVLPAGRPNSAEESTTQAQLDVFAPMQIEGRGP
jgi:general secretion pathway protein M